MELQQQRSFLVSRSSVNRILRRIRRLKNKNQDSIVLYLFVYKNERPNKDNDLNLIIKKYKRGCEESKKKLLENPEFQKAMAFWNEDKINYFKNNFRQIFYAELFVMNRSRADRRGDDDLVTKLIPKEPETLEIMQWFDNLFTVTEN